jgi:hypothetical protein
MLNPPSRASPLAVCATSPRSASERLGPTMAWACEKTGGGVKMMWTNFMHEHIKSEDKYLPKISKNGCWNDSWSRLSSSWQANCFDSTQLWGSTWPFPGCPTLQLHPDPIRISPSPSHVAPCVAGIALHHTPLEERRVHGTGGVDGRKPGRRWKHSYWKWPFIVDFPIENGDFP